MDDQITEKTVTLTDKDAQVLAGYAIIGITATGVAVGWLAYKITEKIIDVIDDYKEVRRLRREAGLR